MASSGSSRPEWEACDAKDSWGYHACFDKCFIPKTPAMVEENCGKRPLPDTKVKVFNKRFPVVYCF